MGAKTPTLEERIRDLEAAALYSPTPHERIDAVERAMREVWELVALQLMPQHRRRFERLARASERVHAKMADAIKDQDDYVAYVASGVLVDVFRGIDHEFGTLEAGREIDGRAWVTRFAWLSWDRLFALAALVLALVALFR